MKAVKEQFDVIVVGSGPGGATVAKELSQKGNRVLILERGGNPKLKGTFLHYFLYQCIPFKSMLLTNGLVGVVRGLITGGSSVFYYGTCFDVPFEMLKKYGVDLEDSVGEISSELPIAPLRDDVMGAKAKRIMESAQELGYDWKKLNKFMYQDRWDPATQKFGNYYYGDPADVKWSARMFVNEAIRNGATLINKARVKRVLVENNCAVGVEFSKWGRNHKVFAPKIVVAAGGIGSPQILRATGIENAGNDFFFDPLISVVGYVKGLPQQNEIPMSAGMHVPEGGYVMTDMALPKMLNTIFAASAFRFWRLFSHKKAIRIMVKVRDDLGGTLKGDTGVRKSLTKSDKEKLMTGYRHARRILKNAGAKGIYKTWYLAAHPGGTVKIGESVDENLETAYKNLFVCDCSVIPEAWGLPPTQTILGLGKRLSDHIASELNPENISVPEQSMTGTDNG